MALERPWRRYVPSAELAEGRPGAAGSKWEVDKKKMAVDQAKLESLALLASGYGLLSRWAFTTETTRLCALLLMSARAST